LYIVLLIPVALFHEFGHALVCAAMDTVSEYGSILLAGTRSAPPQQSTTSSAIMQWAAFFDSWQAGSLLQQGCSLIANQLYLQWAWHLLSINSHN
jgi:hypothetical protein